LGKKSSNSQKVKSCLFYSSTSSTPSFRAERQDEYTLQRNYDKEAFLPLSNILFHDQAPVESKTYEVKNDDKKIFTNTSKNRALFQKSLPALRNTRVMRPFTKCLIIRGNRSLQIFGYFFVVQNATNIVLNIPILASQSLPLTLQKLSFCPPKGKLSHRKRIPFAKPEVKNGIFASSFSISHSRLKIFRSVFLVIYFDNIKEAEALFLFSG
jgi:hypothetical protein